MQPRHKNRSTLSPSSRRKFPWQVRLWRSKSSSLKSKWESRKKKVRSTVNSANIKIVNLHWPHAQRDWKLRLAKTNLGFTTAMSLIYFCRGNLQLPGSVPVLCSPPDKATFPLHGVTFPLHAQSVTVNGLLTYSISSRSSSNHA
jgi:hypothetical protein